jgi:transposase-like protein
MNCPTCNSTNLVYEGDFSAPGFGQSYKCNCCGANLRKAYGVLQNLKHIDPSDLDMDPADCI